MKKSFAALKKRLAQWQKAVDKKRQKIAKALARKFRFLKVWRRAAVKQLRKLGNAIAAASPSWLRTIGRTVWRPFASTGRRVRVFLNRRPHRSFRLTRRRDYKRSLTLPGYWSFTNQVRSMLWRNRIVFGGLMLAYFLIAVAVGGFGQQEAYANLSDTLKEASGDIFAGNWGQVGQAGLLLTTALTTGLTPNVTAAQSILGGLTVFFTWLATVWALRNVMADRKVRIRDAIYSSGSPVIPTAMVSLTLIVQLLPFAIAVLVYQAATYSGLIEGGVEGMLTWVVLLLLGVLSLYWITSTVIALVVVTLPGMYPMQAIRTAGDLVVGRRLRILYRLIWAALLVAVIWLLLVIPIILGDAWIKELWPAIVWLPIVPIAILLMSSVTVVWAATYIYMLYRKVVDDDASPA